MRRIISAPWRPHQTHPQCGATCAYVHIIHTRTYTIIQLCMCVPFTFASRARGKSCARRAIVSGAIRHTAMPHARCMCSAPRWLGKGCTCTYAHSFLFSFFPVVIQLTVVASLHRADVFRVRLGGHCKEFGAKPCSNVAYFSIR